MRFLSDNTGTISPAILSAIIEANADLARPYGEDSWTRRLDEVFSRFFETDVRVYPVSTGTAANSLALATLAPPYSSILVHQEGHIVRDEYGAPEFFTGGARVIAMSGEHARLTTQSLNALLDSHPPSQRAAVLSVTQATEYGTVYRPAELAALCQLAHNRGLRVHMDGARFANAVAFLGCQPADITWRVGVDVLCFGATKNGALAAEAVVFFDPALARDIEARLRRGGHRLSKSRFISAQLLAYVESGVWLENARRANELAGLAAQGAQQTLQHPVEANELFLLLGEQRKQGLRELGFEFYDWGTAGSGEARFVISWDQTRECAVQLADALRGISA